MPNPEPISLYEAGIFIEERGISLENEGGYKELNVYEQATKKREGARQLIAIIVVSCLAFIVLASFISLCFVIDITIDGLIKVIEAVTSPVVGIVGAVTGFYFGEAQRPVTTSDRKDADSPREVRQDS